MQHTQNNAIIIEPAFYIFVAFSLLIIPAGWVLGWLIAVTFHELCHFIVLKLFRINIYSIRVGINGTVMETEPMSALCECTAALAGPVGGLCLIFVSRWAPCVSICALLQSTYNLIPIFPLDGGRVIHRLLRSNKHTHIFELAVILLITALSVFLSIRFKLGLYPLFIPLLLFQKCGLIKYPCKLLKQIVQ